MHPSSSLPPSLPCLLPSGKTTVARLLARLLHMVGLLPSDRVVEVQRSDLVGEFVGHTGPKTRRKVSPPARCEGKGEGEGGGAARPLETPR